MPSLPAPNDIQKLVERFQLHRDDYTNPKYNETQLRREFVDPFFIALGWDVDNKQDYAEAYKDVVHEDAIKIGTKTKAPDYSFRIGGNRKFFVETKKPSVNLKDDPKPAFQLRRYGWSAKLPLSILTDFEEFSVYDCRVKPSKTDKSSTARSLYLNYEDYADRWTEIENIFSREAILKGSFDKYAASHKRKRGTAEVDDAFLEEIEEWRLELAKNLALRNKELDTRELNFAVQKTIDRIIFLRICEDRGIEPYGKLQGLTNGENVYPRLVELFRHADNRFNSGLFHFQKEKDRPQEPDELTPKLNIDDKILKKIVENLYYPCPYEFSVLSADILGQVYEQFLGKVIRLTKGHQAKVEDKPEVKKAGGVYYTPTYIVDYIVENTVGKLVEGKTPRQVSKLRILDPACGSGSFLLGSYQFLLDWHRDYYLEKDTKKKKKEIYQTGKGEWRLTTAERKRILLNNIYGVDIDSQAVEVTKLSLLLKVLEGETDESLQRLLFAKERALPDLGNNIKCGNSLIGPDFYHGKQMELFDEDEMLRINVFDWETEFREIMKAGGFDAVIGNPPYRRELDYKPLMDEIADSKIGKKYRCARMDLWYYFVHKGLELLNSKGLLSFIVNSYWTSGTGAEKLISQLRDEAHIDEIFFFKKLRVFKKVSNQHMTLKISKTTSKAPTVIKIVNPTIEKTAEPFVKGFSVINEIKKNKKQLFRNSKVDLEESNDELLLKIESNDSLDSIAEIRQGIAENPSVINKKTKQRFSAEWKIGEGVFALTREELEKLNVSKTESVLIRPYYDLCDIGRFYLNSQSSLKLIYSSKYTCPDIKKFPRIKKHLEKFREIMEERRETKKGSNQWWHLHWPREEKIWESDKILSVQMGQRPQFTTAIGSVYVSFSVNVILLHESNRDKLFYITSILNSRLIWKWLQHNAKRRGVGLEINGNVLKRVPIRMIREESKADVKTFNRLVTLVESILDVKVRFGQVKTAHQQTALKRQIEATDNEIDRLVYELYGLTDEEIRIVEEATR